MEEHPEFKTKKLIKEIEDAARLSLELEFNFIDKVFELGDLENLTKEELKNFIKHRINVKLNDLGYNSIIDDIDVNSVNNMKWFDHLSAGKQHTDFFANRVTNYSKGHMSWEMDEIF
jgi:ribonucleoside-diphosphate reductase beta chain